MGSRSLSPEQGLELTDTGISVQFVPTSATERVDFNLEHPHLLRPEVRRALLLALDRDRLVARATAEKGRPAGSWLCERHYAYRPLAFGGTDIYRGQRLLAAAGYRPRVGAWVDEQQHPLRFELLVPQDDPVRERLAQDLTAAWLGVGAQATIRTAPESDIRRLVRQRRFDAVLCDWSCRPESTGWSDWHSSQIPSRANGWTGRNYSGWVDRQGDRLLDRAEVEFDPRRRRELVLEHQALFARDLPAIVLYHRVDVVAHHRNLAGIIPGGWLGTPVTWNVARWRWNRLVW